MLIITNNELVINNESITAAGLLAEPGCRLSSNELSLDLLRAS